MRTDSNNNPTAMTTDVAVEAGLVKGVDYVDGDPFPAPSPLITAKLLGDPINITIRVIDKIGFHTKSGLPRWAYINIPVCLWRELVPLISELEVDMISEITKRPLVTKQDIIGLMYQYEGGTAMRSLFPNYGKL